jgi:hypothetical protein
MIIIFGKSCLIIPMTFMVECKKQLRLKNTMQLNDRINICWLQISAIYIQKAKNMEFEKA